MPRPSQRSAVLAAARELILRDGYATTSVRSIASAAGFTTGAIYSNFSGKAEILGILLQEVWELLGEHVSHELGRREGRARVRCLFDAYRRFAEEQQGAFDLLMHYSLHPELGDSLEEPIASTIRQRESERLAAGLEAVRQDQADGQLPQGDPAPLLAAYAAMVDGLMYSRRSRFYTGLGVTHETVDRIAEDLFFPVPSKNP